ncbi:hypothetical protein RDI58_001178 [Solanum bulbocastanum]|uniref:Uncharacterized protein n=1 Tax=Solanum bulbocastanum TaxID=147425 RepID=A0AAN8U4M5_SOLBU
MISVVKEDAVMSKITSPFQLQNESVFYENIGSSSASTTQPQDCSFDARLEMQKQVDKILQERLPILIAGLPKPPPTTLPTGTPPTGTPP